MITAHLHLDPAFVVGALNRRIFGTFVEHMGRCVYSGIYEPSHPTADAQGFRQDVAELVRELGPTVVRYPGGNFVSNYRWEDGVGPVDQRPTRLDYAWRSIETNQVGTDEFLGWCERMGIEPMLAVNLGTRGLNEAMDYLEYVNGDASTELSDRRRANGRDKPWDVRTWCLGNEMDGPWQMGHKTPTEYARIAEEVGNAFLRFDDTLELVACGSSNRGMPTFGEWERIVLEACFESVTHISAHAYYEPHADDTASYLCVGEDMSRFINSVVATADHVAALKRSEKKINISFDEWNVWFQKDFEGERSLEISHAPHLIEDTYSVMDAVVVGSLLITLMRHTDRVSMACQAQLVNIIAPIRTTPGGTAWRQTIFYPFSLTARHAHGTVLQVAGEAGTVQTADYGDVDQVLSTATWQEETGDLVIFAVNRGFEDAQLSLDLSRFEDLEVTEHLMLHEPDPALTNTQEHPNRVQPREGDAHLNHGRLNSQMPAVSWHCIRLSRRVARA